MLHWFSLLPLALNLMFALEVSPVALYIFFIKNSSTSHNPRSHHPGPNHCHTSPGLSQQPPSGCSHFSLSLGDVSSAPHTAQSYSRGVRRYYFLFKTLHSSLQASSINMTPRDLFLMTPWTSSPSLLGPQGPSH